MIDSIKMISSIHISYQTGLNETIGISNFGVIIEIY